MKTIYQVIESIWIVCFVVGDILLVLYFALKEWFDNRLMTVRVDDNVFENVKCELSPYCNEVKITFPKDKRTVILTYEEFEILKD